MSMITWCEVSKKDSKHAVDIELLRDFAFEDHRFTPPPPRPPPHPHVMPIE